MEEIMQSAEEPGGAYDSANAYPEGLPTVFNWRARDVVSKTKDDEKSLDELNNEFHRMQTQGIKTIKEMVQVSNAAQGLYWV